MNSNYILALLIFFNISFAQEANPKKTVDDFFIAFHAKDNNDLKKLCNNDIVMKTIDNKKEGNKLVEEKFNDFLN